MAAAKNCDGLTSRQEAFAQALAGGASQAAAYKQAYPGSLKWTDKTLWNRASELAAHSGVKGRVTSLRAPAVARAELTVDVYLAKLEALGQAALGAGEFSAAIRAAELVGKVSGFFVTRIEANVSAFPGWGAEKKAATLQVLEDEIARRKLLDAPGSVTDVEDAEARP